MIRAQWKRDCFLKIWGGGQETPLRIRLKFSDKCLYLNIFTRHIKELLSLKTAMNPIIAGLLLVNNSAFDKVWAVSIAAQLWILFPNYPCREGQLCH